MKMMATELAAHLLGSERLFENALKVVFEEVRVAAGSASQPYQNALPVTVTVDEPVAGDSAEQCAFCGNGYMPYFRNPG